MLVDPFDEFLRQLSTNYLEAAFAKISNGVMKAGAKPSGLRVGSLHNGVAVIDALRNEPLAFLGWLWEKWPKDLTEDGMAEIARGLDEESPRIKFGCSYRTLLYDVAPSDAAGMLKLIHEQAGEERTDWAPEWLEPGLVDGSLFARIVKAYSRNGAVGVQPLLEEAKQAYTTDGYDVVRVGIDTWLSGVDAGAD